jgi:2'-5' RNA ligase
VTTPVDPEMTALTDPANAVMDIITPDADVEAVTAAAETSTGAMIALVPSQGNIERLALDGGEDAEQLHMTVLYLGDASQIPEDVAFALMDELVSLTEEETGPVVADGFNVSLFNPHSEERDTCVTLGLSGKNLSLLCRRIQERILDKLTSYGLEIPEQHEPWIPHVTLAYTDDHDMVSQCADRTGDITFDRLRFALGGDVYDLDLVPDGDEEEISDVPVEDSEEFQALSVVEADNPSMIYNAAGGDPVTAVDETTIQDEGDVQEQPVEDAAEPGAWSGVLIVEDVESGDGRMFASGSLKVAPLPLPLMWQKQTASGHETAVQVGRIDEVWREGSQIWGAGVFDLQGTDGQEAYRQVEAKFLRGVSGDVDKVKNADVEMIFPKITGDEAEADVAKLFTEPEVTVFHNGRLRGATLVQFPAFVEASISLDGPAALNTAPVIEASARETVEPLGEVTVTAHAELNGERIAVGTITVPASIVQETATQELNTEVEPPAFTIQDQGHIHQRAELTACGCTDEAPPAEFFGNPGLDAPTPLTVTEDGRIYGHAAVWGTCHTGFSGQCVTPPRERDHDYFLLGETLCADGSTVATGTITLGTGHASTGGGVTPFDAIKHYDHTGTVVADITTGEDKFGLWFSGAIRPGASPIKLRSLRAAKLSGDWRKFGNKLRLVALLAVNVPGFPVPRLRTAMSQGRQMALVAAGVNPASLDDIEEQKQADALCSVVASLAKRIGRDPETRMSALKSRIHGR